MERLIGPRGLDLEVVVVRGPILLGEGPEGIGELVDAHDRFASLENRHLLHEPPEVPRRHVQPGNGISPVEALESGD